VATALVGTPEILASRTVVALVTQARGARTNAVLLALGRTAQQHIAGVASVLGKAHALQTVASTVAAAVFRADGFVAATAIELGRAFAYPGSHTLALVGTLVAATRTRRNVAGGPTPPGSAVAFRSNAHSGGRVHGEGALAMTAAI